MKINIYFAVAGAMLIFGQSGFAAMGSTNYSITTTVISGGGTAMASTSFQTNGTIGQPSLLIPAVSTGGYELYPGFWYTLVKSNCIWDIFNDNDGDVDGFDLSRFIDTYDTQGLENFAQEFGRTDCAD